MADIAMLVAEEYERRVKNARINGEDVDLMSCMGLWTQNLKGSCSWIIEKITMEEEKLIKGVLEPKYQISLAASNGLFSA